MTGDAERQPVEGVSTLDDLAGEMDSSEVEQEDVPEVEDEGEVPDAEEDSPEDEDESEEQPEEDEDEDEPVFTIKVDGKETTVKQSELIELGQKGLDYTKKTMAVAEERKAVEAERESVKAARKQTDDALAEALNRLQAYSQFMEAQIGQPPPISLAQQDAAQYLAQKELYESRKGQLHQAYSEIQRLQDETARNRQAVIAEKAASTEKALKDTLPGWNDAMLEELAGYAKQRGLGPQVAEMAMLEPGFWEVMHKAKAFDALQAEKAKLKPVIKTPKVQKPSAHNQPVKRSDIQRKEAEKKFHSAPSLDTLAGLIE